MHVGAYFWLMNVHTGLMNVHTGLMNVHTGTLSMCPTCAEVCMNKLLYHQILYSQQESLIIVAMAVKNLHFRQLK